MPLRHAGQVLGVLVLAWDTVQPFDHDMRDTLTAMALFTAGAVAHARLLDEQATAAATLQEVVELPATED